MATENTKILLITDDISISQPVSDTIKENANWELIEKSDIKQAQQLLLSGDSANDPNVTTGDTSQQEQAEANNNLPDVILVSNPQRGDRQAATRAIKEGSFNDVPTIMLLEEGQKVYGSTKKKISGTIDIKPSFKSSAVDKDEIRQAIEDALISSNKSKDSIDKESEPEEMHKSSTIQRIIEQKQANQSELSFAEKYSNSKNSDSEISR